MKKTLVIIAMVFMFTSSATAGIESFLLNLGIKGIDAMANKAKASENAKEEIRIAQAYTKLYYRGLLFNDLHDSLSLNSRSLVLTYYVSMNGSDTKVMSLAFYVRGNDLTFTQRMLLWDAEKYQNTKKEMVYKAFLDVAGVDLGPIELNADAQSQPTPTSSLQPQNDLVHPTSFTLE